VIDAEIQLLRASDACDKENKTGRGEELVFHGQSN
jgi:hypothetical protein